MSNYDIAYPYEDLKSQIDDYKAKLTRLNESLTVSIDGNRSKDAFIGTLSQENLKFKTRIMNLESQFTKLQDRHVLTIMDTKDLNAKNSELHNKNSALEKQILDLNEEIRELKELNHGLQMTIDFAELGTTSVETTTKDVIETPVDETPAVETSTKDVIKTVVETSAKDIVETPVDETPSVNDLVAQLNEINEANEKHKPGWLSWIGLKRPSADTACGESPVVPDTATACGDAPVASGDAEAYGTVTTVPADAVTAQTVTVTCGTQTTTINTTVNATVIEQTDVQQSNVSADAQPIANDHHVALIAENGNLRMQIDQLRKRVSDLMNECENANLAVAKLMADE
jgi:regulator of replication initiation timing